MRIERLDLEKYGHFNDTTFDFSGDDIGLHIIYGANEAGKSTALAAIADLLFGFPHKTGFDFLYEMGLLRVGGVLTKAAGDRIEFKRRKGRKNDVLKPDESGHFAEDILHPFLGRMDRERFERLFGMDHHRLRQGGDAMLEAEGDIGRTLFEAGSATTNLASVIQLLREDATAIGDPSGRKSGTRPYFQARDRWDEARKQRDREALKTSEWTAAEKKLIEARDHLQQTENERKLLRQQQSALQRVRLVAPILREIDNRTAELEALGEGVDLPEGFEATWRQAILSVETAKGDEKRAQEDLEEASKELDGLESVDPWPRLKARIEKLGNGINDYRGKRDRSIPHREDEMAAALSAISDLVSKLGSEIAPDEIDKKAPLPKTKAEIRTLIREWDRLDEALAKARQEKEQSAKAVADLEGQLEGTGDALLDPAEADVAMTEAVAKSNAETVLLEHRRTREQIQGDLQEILSALPRWSDDADALASTTRPSREVVSEHAQSLSNLEQLRKQHDEDLDSLTDEKARLEKVREEIESSGEVPTEEALLGARDHRDTGWDLIRSRYVESNEVSDQQIEEYAQGSDLAGVYEIAVRHADDLADGQKQDAERIALFKKNKQELDNIEIRLRRNSDSRNRIEDELKAWNEAWHQLWRSSKIEPGTPTEMREWLVQAQDVLSKRQGLKNAIAAERQAEASVQAYRDHLLRAAAALGLSGTEVADNPTLKNRVTVELSNAKKAWQQAGEIQTSLRDRQRELKARTEGLNKEMKALEDWQQRWSAAAPLIGLSSDSSTAEAEQALQIWQQIEKEQGDYATASKRRREMLEDIENYEADVAAVVAELGDTIDLKKDDCAEKVLALLAELSNAMRREDKISTAKKRQEKAEEKLRAASDQVKASDKKVADLLSLHSLTEDADIPLLSKNAAERRRVSSELKAQQERLIREGAGLSPDELRTEIEKLELDIDAVTAEIDRLSDEIGRWDDVVAEANRELATAEQELRALGDREGVAKAAQEANSAAAEMMENVEQWVRLHTAQAILTRAVERYRQANEHPLVTRASEIFAAIAGHATNPIVRLSVDYMETDEPELVAYREDGGVVRITGMSDGTRDQLYLALRIAAIERYMEASEPLPFIADDLFITSDEERTAAGIKALAELGKRTQVLLFTHHQYVIDAANENLHSQVCRIHGFQ